MNEKLNVRRGQIYWVDIPEIEGSSIQSGIHPYVILQNDMGNKYSPTCQIGSLTSKLLKKSLPMHVNIQKDLINNLEKDSIFLAETTTTIPKFFIGDYIGKVDEETMKEIDKAVKIQLGLNNIDENFIEKLVFSVRKSKEMFDKYRDSELLSMYNGALYELKSYCEEHRVDYRKYYYEDNDKNNTRIAQAV